MRVIVKPAGALVLLAALAALGVLAFGRPSKPGGASPAAATTAPGAAVAGPSGTLTNGDMEAAETVTLRPDPAKKSAAEVTGTVGASWFDNSDWADLKVSYALDPKNPHGGKVSQRIDVGRIGVGQVQFAQALRLAGGKGYRVSLWMRASRPATAEFGLRATSGGPLYGPGAATLGTGWERYEVTGKVPEGSGDSFLMVIVKEPEVTVWVDDVALEEAAAGAGAKAAVQ